jgi:hypothetical protein
MTLLREKCKQNFVKISEALVELLIENYDETCCSK